MPTSEYIEASATQVNTTATTQLSLPSYNASMFENAELEDVVIERVQNYAGPDRSGILQMFALRQITIQEFQLLDKIMMTNNRENMSTADAVMFKDLKAKGVQLRDIVNSHNPGTRVGITVVPPNPPSI